VSLGACLASISAHRACVQVDREAIASLEARVKEGRKSAGPDVCNLKKYDLIAIRDERK